MADQAELAFARTFLNTLSTQPITYGNDYQQPLENSLKRIPIFPVGFIFVYEFELISNWLLLNCDRFSYRLRQNDDRLRAPLQVPVGVPLLQHPGNPLILSNFCIEHSCVLMVILICHAHNATTLVASPRSPPITTPSSCLAL